jgi:ribosomal protein L12E/L44/L45/RPP1/RPP2
VSPHPELADTLTAIDEALAEQHYLSARRHLRHLVDTVEAARSSGDLEDAQADRVLAAAAHLLAALPAPPRVAEPPREPEPGPEPQDDEDDEENEGDEESEDD